MRMRTATIDEASVLAAIHAQCFRHETWNAAAIAGLMATPGTVVIADEEGWGFIMVRAAGGEAEVLTLGVTPAARRRGIGRALVLAGAERAAGMGAEVLFLEVNAANIPAVALYKGLGFAKVGVRKDYYRTAHGMREDALVLSVSIPLLRVGNSLQLG